jgi:homoserine/homoserine lactone efflux protein
LNIELYVTYTITALILIATPGPTVMFVTSISIRHGATSGLIAVAGSTVAAAFQLGVVVAGLASVVSLAGDWFELIRWAGVAYLVYLGLSALLGWSAASADGADDALAAPSFREGAQGFIVTLTNPKMLLFHGAFLPQFVDPALPPLPQMLVLATTFVVLAGVGDSVWALLGARLGTALQTSRARRLADRVSGSLLIGAGVALATVRRADG